MPEIWRGNNIPTIETVREFFNGEDIPKFASDEILLEAIRSAVQNGLLMARHPNRAYLKEEIPDAEMTDDLELPRAISTD